MPEIAEVETVRRVLKGQILNKKIVKVDVFYPKMIESDLKDFQTKLINESFIDILRKGKYLIFELNNYYLLSHLRMEGKYFVKDINDAKDKHEHVIFTFSDNITLRYADVRKFGKMKLINKNQLEDDEDLKKLGIEPIDSSLSAKYLIEKFKKKNLPIKTVLLDQSIIAGLGNIYADEVLFKSGINPLKKACDINEDEAKKICLSSKEIIEKAIEYKGTTIRSYTSSLGVKGNYQDFLSVHTKEGEKCKNCNTIIKRIKVNGRSTYYCPNCQK